tara:strand:+ start:555 stop:1016 length:462 start_codon:yes stop_codon:yes gene_type:complete
MSLENSILELAKAMNNNAEAIREANKPINMMLEERTVSEEDVSKVEATTTTPKPKVTRTSRKTKVVDIAVATPAEPTKEEAPKVATVVEEPVQEDRAVTHEDVHLLAKSKMRSPGITRDQVRDIINGISKGAQISDLTSEQLVVAYGKIELLK